MTTLRERTKEAAQKIVGFTGYGQSLHVNDILPDLNELLRQEFLALAEEIEATKQPNDPGFANTEAAKDYGKLDDLADYAETVGANTALVSAAALIRSKADELV